MGAIQGAINSAIGSTAGVLKVTGSNLLSGPTDLQMGEKARAMLSSKIDAVKLNRQISTAARARFRGGKL